MRHNISICALLACIALTTRADTLELADGTLLEGDFVGSSNGIIMFDTGDNIKAFPEAEVVGVFLSAGVAAAEAARAAAIGGLVSGSSGARTGARVGAGASILTGGAGINIPAGTMVETNLTAAVELPRSS